MHGSSCRHGQPCTTIAAQYNSSSPKSDVHLASLGYASSWQYLVCPLHESLVGSGMIRVLVIQTLLLGLQLSLQSCLLVLDGLPSLPGQLEQSLCTFHPDFLVQVSMPEQYTGMRCEAAHLLSRQLLLCLLQPSSGRGQGCSQSLPLIQELGSFCSTLRLQCRHACSVVPLGTPLYGPGRT